MMTQESFVADFATTPEWAAMYRALGVQVVPAKHPVEDRLNWKRPALPAWRDLEHALTPDLTFERWFGSEGEHAKRQNIGILTGACSAGIFVVDLDTHKNPACAEWWAGLLALHNSNMAFETPIQTTGGGGKQMLFRAPPGWTPPTCKTSLGVDVRGQGGFAMLPPSMHASGKNYWWDAGCEPWHVDIADAPEWLCEAIDELVTENGGSTQANPRERVAASAATNEWGRDTDGREDKMARLIWARLVQLRREAPMISRAELEAALAEAWEVYERTTATRISGPGTNAELLEREGRGLTSFRDKWWRACRKWDDEIHAEAAKVPQQAVVKAEPLRADYEPPEGVYELLNVKAIKTMPDPKWMVKDLVIENAMGFVYGPPGCLKTFICLDMALSFSVGMPDWWGRGVERHGAVIYISTEGQSDLKFRIQAWEQKNGVFADEAPFFLMRQTINFMKEEDVGRLLATVQSVIDHHKVEVAAVFVDTVSRVLPGADENLQKDMTLFIAACDAVRQRFSTVVVGVHHTARAGNMRGSTVFPGAGDFMLEVDREPGAKVGLIRATKIKAAADGWEQAFAVDEIVLGLGGHSSLVVSPTDASPPKDKKLSANDQAVLNALKRSLDDGGSNPGLTAIPSSARCVRENLWRQTFYAMSVGEASTKQKSFVRAVQRLQDARTVGVWGEWCWITNS